MSNPWTAFYVPQHPAIDSYWRAEVVVPRGERPPEGQRVFEGRVEVAARTREALVRACRSKEKTLGISSEREIVDHPSNPTQEDSP